MSGFARTRRRHLPTHLHRITRALDFADTWRPDAFAAAQRFEVGRNVARMSPLVRGAYGGIESRAVDGRRCIVADCGRESAIVFKCNVHPAV
jgi:hypothetical protein